MKGRLRISEEMERLDMNKSELARRCRMQQSTIGWIVSGRFIPYESQLEKIANALDWQDDPNKLLEEVDL